MFSLKTHFSFGAVVVVLRSTIMKYWLLISKFLLSSSLVWFGTLEIGKCSLVITNGWFHSVLKILTRKHIKSITFFFEVFLHFSGPFLLRMYQNIDFRLLAFRQKVLQIAISSDFRAHCTLDNSLWCSKLICCLALPNLITLITL